MLVVRHQVPVRFRRYQWVCECINRRFFSCCCCSVLSFFLLGISLFAIKYIPLPMSRLSCARQSRQAFHPRAFSLFGPSLSFPLPVVFIPLTVVLRPLLVVWSDGGSVLSCPELVAYIPFQLQQRPLARRILPTFLPCLFPPPNVYHTP